MLCLTLHQWHPIVDYHSIQSWQWIYHKPPSCRDPNLFKPSTKLVPEFLNCELLHVLKPKTWNICDLVHSPKHGLLRQRTKFPRKQIIATIISGRLTNVEINLSQTSRLFVIMDRCYWLISGTMYVITWWFNCSHSREVTLISGYVSRDSSKRCRVLPLGLRWAGVS